MPALNYTTRLSIENVYGKRNVEKWADLNNDSDPTFITNRIVWAGEMATEYINSWLAQGKFTTPLVDVPRLIINIASMLAGVMLHDGRTIVSSEPDQIGRQRKQVDKQLRQILSGQLRLLHPASGEPILPNCLDVPSVAVEGEI